MIACLPHQHAPKNWKKRPLPIVSSELRYYARAYGTVPLVESYRSTSQPSCPISGPSSQTIHLDIIGVEPRHPLPRAVAGSRNPYYVEGIRKTTSGADKSHALSTLRCISLLRPCLDLEVENYMDAISRAQKPHLIYRAKPADI